MKICEKCGIWFNPEQSRYWPNVKDSFCESCVSAILQGVADKPIPQKLYRQIIAKQIGFINMALGYSIQKETKGYQSKRPPVFHVEETLAEIENKMKGLEGK